jgi:hypothetical protein
MIARELIKTLQDLGEKTRYGLRFAGFTDFS